MRVLSWNIDSWKISQAGSWNYILSQVKPDIALIQECKQPEDLGQDPDRNQLLLDLIGGSRPWGSAIYSKYLKLKRVEVAPEANGWVMAAETKQSDQSRLLVVSIHVRIEGVPYVAPGLRVLIQKIKALSQNYDHLILGGDLNVARSYDQGPSGSSNPKYQHSPIFDLLESSWCNCSMKQYHKEIQTIWTTSTKHPYQNDYLFVDRDLEERFIRCIIPERVDVESLSDHSPVFVDLA